MGPTKDVIFYEYKKSKELFNTMKNNQIKFSEAKNKQNEFLNKLSDRKTGKKLSNKKKQLITLKNVIFLEKKFLIFLRLRLY